MTNKRFITAKDVVEELGVSISYAYKLIEKRGFDSYGKNN